ncbi:unnamed protein product, partial [Mesorhabditis belari]|uniref:Uncharacterized protein n=1 Tax=Mesorhabditis belari TaxID=2138241 RepID=A0AAF3EN00_9BILA
MFTSTASKQTSSSQSTRSSLTSSSIGQGATYNGTSAIGQGARVSYVESPRSPRTPMQGHLGTRTSSSRTQVSTYTGSRGREYWCWRK